MSRRNDADLPQRGIKTRPTGNRVPAPVILIVCEGGKTEPGYFSDFPVPKAVREIYGVGMDPLRLVQEAKKRQRDYRQDHGYDYGQVWCVFDRDEFPLERFKQALHLARASGFHVAYSNPAFELWYLLHYGYSDRPMERHDCCSEFSVRLGCQYVKNQRYFRQLEPLQASAIRHAAKLLQQYDDPDPASDNPSTTVHLLVEALNLHRQR